MQKQEQKKSDKKKIIRNALITVGVLLVAQSAFIGWRYSFGPLKKLGNIRLSGLAGNASAYSFDAIVAMENSPLAGKNVLFLGSSVTNGHSSLYSSIPEYIAARFGCNYTKEAVDGTTLVDNGASSYVQRLITKVDPADKYDLVVVQLSTNDASKNQPLGEIAKGDYNTATITGAMEYIVNYVKGAWDCPVVFFTNAKFDSEPYAAMVKRLCELQSKYGIGVLNLWDNAQFNDITAEQRSIYMYDNIHPTKAGYRDWWGPELEQQLCAFMAQQ